MPLYEYGCTKCGKVMEVLAKMGDRGKELVCPACGSKSLEKKISVPAPPSMKGAVPAQAGCGEYSRCENASPACGMGGCCSH